MPFGHSIAAAALAPATGRARFSAGKKNGWSRMIGRSPACRRLEASILRLAQVGCTTLISGETGCGKGEVARAIHASGPRSERPFVPVNCGGLPAGLAESQLFGHEKGSFTGAVGATRGAFRAADGGVLFLDEIGELPLELQPKLLQVLESREVTPVGSTRLEPVDVQVIAATNRDLEAEVEEGRFREDLYYRLNTVQLVVPPLRERPEDIPRFIDHFSGHFAARYDQPAWEPSPAALARLQQFSWPGNVRQLAQTVERHYVFGGSDDHLLDQLFSGSERAVSEPAVGVGTLAAPARERPAAEPPTFNLREVRNRTVRAAMAATNNHFGEAAKLLGVAPNTLTKLVAEACPELSRKRPSRRAAIVPLASQRRSLER